MSKRISGDQFLCPKHGLDYRLLCEDCLEKSDKFRAVTEKMIEANAKPTT